MTTANDNGGTAARVDSHVAGRFMRYFEPGPRDRCWEWKGAKTRQGYGSFSVSHRKQVRAHRFSFLLHRGRQPSELLMHTCDNRGCVNPDHLREGTHGDNMKDMVAKKRQARAERHGRALLKAEEVQAIRLLHASGDYTHAELAEMFGVAKPTIGKITRGENWPEESSP